MGYRGIFRIPSSARRAVWTALSVLVVAVYIVRVVMPATARTDYGSFAGYYTAASILWSMPDSMAHIYEDAWFIDQIHRLGFDAIQDSFFYHPPTAGLLWLPLIALPPFTARFLWSCFSLMCLLGGLMILAHTFDLPKRYGIWIMPLCLLYAPVTENIRSDQAYLFLFFLLCLMLRMLVYRRRYADDMGAGALLGGMLVLKTATAWLWPLLFLAGRRRVILWAGMLAGSIFLLSWAWMGLQPWRIYFTLLPDLAVTPVRYVTAYQTVTSLFGHLLAYDAGWNPYAVADRPLIARIGPLMILGITLGLSVRWGRLNADEHETRVLTFALFLSLAIANAPVGEGYHYTTTLIPLLTAYWWAWRNKLSWGAWAVLAGATLCLGAGLPYKSPALMKGWWALLAYPRVYGAFMLWGWLGRALCAESNS